MIVIMKLNDSYVIAIILGDAARKGYFYRTQ